jgi:hypothetical protein
MGHRLDHVDPPPSNLIIGLVLILIGFILSLLGVKQLLNQRKNLLERNNKVNF